MTLEYTPTAEVDRRANNAPDRTRLNADVCNSIIEAVRAGNYFETAVSKSGVSRPAFYGWLRRGRDLIEQQARGIEGPLTERDSLLLDFAIRIHEAEAEAEAEAVASIRVDDAKWWLSRKYPDRWGQKTRVEIGNADGQPFRVQQIPMLDMSVYTEEELDELARLIQKGMTGGEVIEAA